MKNTLAHKVVVNLLHSIARHYTLVQTEGFYPEVVTAQ